MGKKRHLWRAIGDLRGAVAAETWLRQPRRNSLLYPIPPLKSSWSRGRDHQHPGRVRSPNKDRVVRVNGGDGIGDIEGKIAKGSGEW